MYSLPCGTYFVRLWVHQATTHGSDHESEIQDLEAWVAYVFVVVEMWLTVLAMKQGYAQP